MQRLGKMHSRYSTGESFPSQNSDLKDIRNAARQAAAEREQLVDQRFDQCLQQGERAIDLWIG